MVSRRWKGRYSWPAILVLLLVAGCSLPTLTIPTSTPEPTLVQSVPLRVASPESLIPALRAAASVYQQQHPEVEITLLPRADSLIPHALRQGDVDVAVLAWLPQALAEEAWVRPVSRDGLAIIVNRQNGVPELSLSQLQDLYQGRLEDWALWGGLPGPPHLVSRETASGEFAFFQAWVMRDARVSLNALLAPNTEAVLKLVGEDSLAVGYVSSAWLEEGEVRAVAINGVPLARETVSANLYPLTRVHFVVTMKEPDGPARGFIEWLLASPGQTVLAQHGLLPAQMSE